MKNNSTQCGIEDGAICNRIGCHGTIHIHPPKDCSCHISPPCGSCVSPRSFCPICGWEEADEYYDNDLLRPKEPTPVAEDPVAAYDRAKKFLEHC